MVKLRVVPGDFQQAGTRGGDGARLLQQEPTAVQDASVRPDEQADRQGWKSQELPSASLQAGGCGWTRRAEVWPRPGSLPSIPLYLPSGGPVLSLEGGEQSMLWFSTVL